MSFALITGASKGIGKSIAEQLASRRINLLLVARSEDLLRELATSLASQYNITADYLCADLAEEGAAEKILNWCVEKDYHVSILINNAGYGLSGSFEKYAVGENLDMMKVNMLTLVELCQVFLPLLRTEKQSYILNIASSAAYQAIPNLSVYAATKAFVVRFSRGLRQELRKTPVSVTCISPGSTDTDFAKRAKIGIKGLKAAEKVNMTPDQVAKVAIQAMFSKKPEVIVGAINKVGAFLSWILPQSWIERTTMKIYE